MMIEKIKKAKNLASIVQSIKSNIEYYNLIFNETIFLSKDSNLKERLYNIRHDIKDELKCHICKIDKLEWNNKLSCYKNTCKNKKCRKEYFMLNKDVEAEKLRRQKISTNQKNRTLEDKKLIREKIEKTNLARYGVKTYAETKSFKEKMIKKIGTVSPFSLKETHQKTKKTLLERYGVNHNFLIPEVQVKKKETFINNYGYDSPSKNEDIKFKIIKTNLERYGGNSPMCNLIIKQKAINTYNNNYVFDEIKKQSLIFKREETMYNTYGVKYWIQNTDNFDRLTKSKKTSYKLININNKNYFIQGFEDYALIEILLKKYTIEDILISNKEIEEEIGKIYYVSDKKHRYFPDFYLTTDKIIYEVKSEYTYQSDIEINNLKKEACLLLGYGFEFLIIKNKEYKNWKIKNNTTKDEL